MIIAGNSHVSIFRNSCFLPERDNQLIKVNWVGALNFHFFTNNHPSAQKIRALFKGENDWKFFLAGNHDLFYAFHEIHVNKKSKSEFIDFVIFQFIQVLDELNKYGKFVWMCGFPQVNSVDVQENIELFRELVRTFNQKVILWCNNNRVPVISPLTNLMDNDFNIEKKYLQSDGLHLNPDYTYLYLNEIERLTGEKVTYKPPVLSKIPFLIKTETDSFVSLVLEEADIPDATDVFSILPSLFTEKMIEYIDSVLETKGLELSVNEQTDFVDSGLFDSLDLVELYTYASGFFEREPDFDLDLRELNTVASLRDFLYKDIKSEDKVLTKRDFFTSLQQVFSYQNKELINSEYKISLMSDEVYRKFIDIINTVSGNTSVRYGIIYYWQALIEANKKNYNLALNLLEQAGSKDIQFPVNDSRINFYYDLWQIEKDENSLIDFSRDSWKDIKISTDFIKFQADIAYRDENSSEILYDYSFKINKELEIDLVIKELNSLDIKNNLKIVNWLIKGIETDSYYAEHPKLSEIIADISFYEGNYLRAIKYYNKSINKFDFTNNLIYKLAVSYWNAGNVFKSLNYFNILLDCLSVIDESVFCNLLNIMFSLGKYYELNKFYFLHINNVQNLLNYRSLFSGFQKLIVKNNLLNRNKLTEYKFSVSIIISLYKAESYIKGRLDDLVNQSIFTKTEIIIINSNSPENEEEIIFKYLKSYPNIKYFRTNERETIYQSWNRAIKYSSGKYIVNANADDRLKNDALEIMYNELENNPQVSMVYPNVYVTATDNQTFDNHSRIDQYNFPDWNREFSFDNCITGPINMWNRKVFDEYGLYNPDYIVSGDYEFVLRASQTNIFKNIDQFLGLYQIRPDSIEHSNTEIRSREDYQIKKTYTEALNNAVIHGRNGKLPILDFDSTLTGESSDSLSDFYNFDFFVDYHFDPDTKIQGNGYYILVQNWEEFFLPESWISKLNKEPDQIWLPSEFVRDSYIASGIDPDKLEVIPPFIEPEKYPEPHNFKNSEIYQSYKFLFSGPLSERKGLDILIEAFSEEFNINEDVCLVINDDFSGYSNDNLKLRRKVKDLSGKSNIYITEIEHNDSASIYQSCNAFVYPFRTEGSGINILIAMSCSLPVIVTNGGASRDFCNSDNSFLINAEFIESDVEQYESFKLAGNISDFEPDKEHLKSLMRQVYQGKHTELVIKNREEVINNYSWNNVSSKVEKALIKLKNKPVLRQNIADIIAGLQESASRDFEIANYHEAEKKFSKLIKLDDLNSDVIYKLGICQFRLNDFEAAINSFASCLDVGLYNHDIFNYLAQSLEKTGDFETAELYYQQARDFL